MPTPTLYVPASYLVNDAQFGLPTPLDAHIWTWPSNGRADHLRAAAVQHLIAATATRALNRRKIDLAGVARRAGIDQGNLHRALNGKRRIQSHQIAALAGAAEDALPTPNDVHNITVYATTMLAPQVKASGGVVGALGLQTAERLAVVAALAGHRVLQTTPEDEALADTITAVAGPILRRSAIAQATAAGLAPPTDARAAPNDVRLRPTNRYAPPCIRGVYVVPDGPILSGHLPPDWIQTVHEPGWSVLDGHFVIEITARDTDNKPTEIQTLCLEVHEATEDWNWGGFATQPAQVRWSGGQAVVTAR